MVKAHKMFVINYDLVPKLKGINASELVNRLLTDYFNDTKLRALGNEGIKSRIELLEAKAEIEKQLQEQIANG